MNKENDIDFLNWSKPTVKKVDKPKPKLSKRKKEKKILYPIFKDISNKIDDIESLEDKVFWKSKFEEISIGKLPSKFTIKNGQIFYKKTKIIDIEYDILNEMKIIHYIDIFKKNGVVNSLNKMNVVTYSDNNTKSNIWKNLTKNMKSCYLMKFSSKIIENYKLPSIKKFELYKFLKSSLLLDIINKDNIELNSYSITNIRGLIFVKNKFKIDNDNIKLKAKKKDKEYKVKPTFQFSDSFSKLIKNIKINKKNKFEKYERIEKELCYNNEH